MSRPAAATHQGPCDGVAIARAPAGQGGSGWTLAATVLGSSLSFIDGSVVNVALPSIARGLHADAASLPWVVNAYLLPLGALVLIGGSLSDRLGRRQIFLAGIALFALASLITLTAPLLALLIVGRFGQGIGAALFVPASLAILGADFTGAARARAIGTWAAAGAIAGAVGPVMGGWLVDSFGWRAIFALILPWAVVTLVIGWRAIPGCARGSGTIDLAGAVLGALSLGLIVYGLGRLARPEAGAGDGAIAGAGVLLFLGFLWVEYRRGEGAMMPLALFDSRVFAGVTILTFLLYAALGGALLLLPYLLIARGWSATAAGSALLPLPVMMGLGSRPAGALAERHGARLLLTAGPLVTALGFAWLGRMPTGALDYGRDVLPAMLLIGGGMTAAVAPLTATVMAAVAPDHAGAASGVNNATARVGGMIATALVGLALADGGKSVSLPAFHIAAILAALLAAAAGLVGWLMAGASGRG